MARIVISAPGMVRCFGLVVANAVSLCRRPDGSHHDGVQLLNK